MKHYRPHILVVIALAVILSSGWHDAFRNVLGDLRFNWLQRQAGGDIVIVAIDAPSLEKIGVWPWPRRLHAELLRQLEKAGASDIVFDVDFSAPSDAASDREFVEALQRAGGSVVLPWFKQPGADAGNPARDPYQPPAEAVCRPVLGRRGECRGRARWSHSPLSLRREARRRVFAVDGGGAGGTTQQQGCALPDRFRHPRRLDSQGVLRRCAARQSGDACAPEGQEGRRRRDRARAWRSLQHSERRDRFRSDAAGAGGRVDPAAPHAALDVGLGHARWDSHHIAWS